MNRHFSVFKSARGVYILMLICGLIGFTASMALTYEKLEVLKNPAHVPACSINPIISCNSAMSSAQSEFMGVPLSIFGLIAYTALITATVLLIVGVKLPKQIWAMIVGVALAGLAAVHYLIIESIFFMHIICPWCFTVWITTPLIFLGACVGYSATKPNDHKSIINFVVKFISNNAQTIAIVWYASLALTLLVVFWDFWVSLIP